MGALCGRAVPRGRRLELREQLSRQAKILSNEMVESSRCQVFAKFEKSSKIARFSIDVDDRMVIFVISVESYAE